MASLALISSSRKCAIWWRKCPIRCRITAVLFLVVVMFVVTRSIWTVARCTPLLDRLISMPDGKRISLYNPSMAPVRLDSQLVECGYKRDGKLHCPNVKLKGETVTRQLQLSVGRMLRIFDIMSEKYHFDYWLFSGSLLGARRDQLFIPWDQDADVHMMRKDYEIFRKHAAADLPGDVFFQTKESDAAYARVKISNEAKLRDATTCYGYCARSGCKHHDGFQVDIVVFEHTYKDIIEDTYKTYKFSYSDIFPLQDVKYEGFLFKSPNKADNLLLVEFADIKLPPASTRCKKFIGIPWASCPEILQMNSSYREHLLYDTMMSYYPKLLYYFT